jgi:hypothetical protein
MRALLPSQLSRLMILRVISGSGPETPDAALTEAWRGRREPRGEVPHCLQRN